MDSKEVNRPLEATEDSHAEDVLERAFARFQPELLGTLYYLIGNTEDARDAIQEAFIRCWRHRAEALRVTNLKAWIFRIALNVGRDIRGTAWRRRRKPLPEDEAVLASRAEHPEAEATRREELAMLRIALLQLRGEEQEVFLLRQNGDMTYDEIAAATNVPVGTVKTRMRRALIRLRDALGPKSSDA